MIVTLERVSRDDMETIRIWRNLPEIRKWGITQDEIGIAEHIAWFNEMLRDESRIYWIISLDGVGVGVVFLTRIQRLEMSCEWGMYLANGDALGKGVAQAACALSFRHAFTALGVSSVRCEAVAQNETAIGLYESVGYVRTGLKEDAVMRGNEMLSVVTLELTSDAWNAREDHVLQRLSEKGVNIHG